MAAREDVVLLECAYMARGMEGASNQLKEEEEEEDEGIEEEGYTASVPMPLNIYKTHTANIQKALLFFLFWKRERERERERERDGTQNVNDVEDDVIN